MKVTVRSFFTLAVLFLFFSIKSYSDVKLPKLIGDGMVLQREVKVNIWGWADVDEKITLTFQNKKLSAITDKKGKWSLTLPPTNAGGPHQIIINGKNQIILKDILFGDVWVCSGQSNMELQMKRVREKYSKEIASSANPNIRLFYIPVQYNFQEQKDDLPSGNWVSADPTTVLNFSAVAYFFARDLYERYKTPVGLISTAVGGSPVEAWMSSETLKQFPKYLEVANKFKRPGYQDSIRNKESQLQKDWFSNVKRTDQGDKSWTEMSFDDSKWPTLQIPGSFKEIGMNENGVVWLRKEFIINESQEGKAGTLYMGRIVDSDSTYLNGKLVGSISYQYPPRIYNVPEGLLKKGKNVITVRVIINYGNGGFIKEKPYEIKIEDNTIDLKGTWKYQIGTKCGPLSSTTFFQYKPTGLYNAMISPLLNYSIKGVIWYQGESNVDRAKEYHSLFSTMINTWRSAWNQGNFPFLYVQLANLNPAPEYPVESGLAELREAQLKTLEIPNTAMVVTHDIGEWNDIHPLNKADVGKRLALAASKLAYKENITYSGPIFKEAKLIGNKVQIFFNNTGTGLAVKGTSDLQHFAIAGDDGKFVWAKAKIENNKVIVWSEEVSRPAAIRYAWADNPEGANLYNKEGLPASSFQATLNK
jgi:sialate O-acetylesterase